VPACRRVAPRVSLTSRCQQWDSRSDEDRATPRPTGWRRCCLAPPQCAR
jgi:hypothetical protein